MSNFLSRLMEIKWISDFVADFKLNFINDDRWSWLVEGLGNTMLITLFATLIGIAIGIVIAIVRSTYDKNEETLKKRENVDNLVERAVDVKLGAAIKAAVKLEEKNITIDEFNKLMEA